MELNDLKGVVILLGLIALIGAAVAISLDAFKEEIEDNADSAVATNESVTFVNGTYVGVAHTDTLRSCSTVYNGSSGALIISSNWQCAEGQGFWLAENVSSGSFASAVLVTYTFGEYNSAYNITMDGLAGVDNTTDFLDTIGTVVGIAVLIGVLLVAFAVGRR